MAEEAQDKDFKYIVRIGNSDIDGNKAILLSLQKIKGVSFMLANAFCTILKIDKTQKAGTLSDDQIAKLDALLKSKSPEGIPSWLLNRRKDYETGEDIHFVGADLTFLNETDIRRLKKIRSYVGVRHMSKLPVRGQRTKSNFRPNKGKISSKKTASKTPKSAAPQKGGKK